MCKWMLVAVAMALLGAGSSAQGACVVEVVQYLEKYKGRFKLMHVKDMSERVKFAGDGGDSQQWIELFPFLANAGSGVLDLTKIISAAKTSGVKHFIVERDLAPDPENDLTASHDFLQALI